MDKTFLLCLGEDSASTLKLELEQLPRKAYRAMVLHGTILCACALHFN